MLRWTGSPLHTAILLAAATLTFLSSSAWGQTDGKGSQEGLLPRFANVRSGEVNMRTGPGTRYPIDWVLVKRSQPVEIIGEFEVWRQIRDWRGDTGWVHRSMLSSARTIIFTIRTLLTDKAEPGSRPVADIGIGVIGELLECGAANCRVAIDSSQGRYKGWAPIAALWGVRHEPFTAETAAQHE